MYDAVAAGDMRAFSERLHPDIVWEHNIGGGSPEEGTYRGRDDVKRLVERIIEPWESMRLEPEQIEQVEEGTFLVRGKMHMKHATAASEILTPYEQRFEIEDGLVVRGRMTFGQLGQPEAAPTVFPDRQETG
jgi:ketosteroid isomerase-like protein